MIPHIDLTDLIVDLTCFNQQKESAMVRTMNLAMESWAQTWVFSRLGSGIFEPQIIKKNHPFHIKIY